jgi:hypothetical protein
VERPLRTETVETESGYTTVVTGGNHCPLRVSATGALVGAAIAAAVDAALGFERLPPRAPAARAATARTIEPAISIGSGSVGLGLGARSKVLWSPRPVRGERVGRGGRLLRGPLTRRAFGSSASPPSGRGADPYRRS